MFLFLASFYMFCLPPISDSNFTFGFWNQCFFFFKFTYHMRHRGTSLLWPFCAGLCAAGDPCLKGKHARKRDVFFSLKWFPFFYSAPFYKRWRYTIFLHKHVISITFFSITLIIIYYRIHRVFKYQCVSRLTLKLSDIFPSQCTSSNVACLLSHWF